MILAERSNFILAGSYVGGSLGQLGGATGGSFGGAGSHSGSAFGGGT